jgi:hypothetical protein
MTKQKQLLKQVKEDHIGSSISIQYKKEILQSEPMKVALEVYA